MRRTASQTQPSLGRLNHCPFSKWQPILMGQLGLEAYLDRTVFYRPRNFTRDEFRNFIFAQSEPFPETLEVLERLARSKKYLMGTLNNESIELNLYRINRFGLRNYFSVFF